MEMADRYWVGGTGTWDNSNTTNWAATSGGAGGESVPTSADDVYFDSASHTGSYTVTFSNGTNCRNLSIEGPATGNITIGIASGRTHNIYGSFFIAATGVSKSGNSSVFSLLSTSTGTNINTNNFPFESNFQINGGGTFEFQSALSLSGLQFIVNTGTTNTNGYNIFAGVFGLNGGTFNAGSSTLTFVGNQPIANFAGTFNAGTSTINLSSNNAHETGTGANFQSKNLYNLTFGSGSAGTHRIASVGTIENLTIPNRVGTSFLELGVNLTINGTLSIQSTQTNPAVRVLIRPLLTNNVGTQKTITAAAIDIKSVIFQNITGAGAATWSDSSGTNYWNDGGGNVGITFAAPKTVYWNLSGTQNMSATGWATTPTGTPAAANFPLLQDIGVITELGDAGTITFNVPTGNITFDDGVNTRTSVVNVSFTSTIHGSITLSSGVILSGGATFNGPINKTFKSAGKSFPGGITVFTTILSVENLATSARLTLLDNFTTSGSVVLNGGAINLNNNILTALTFAIGGVNTGFNAKGVDFGTSGKIVLTGSNAIVWDQDQQTFSLSPSCFVSGSRIVELSAAAGSGTRTVRTNGGGGFLFEYTVKIIVTSGTDTISMTSTTGTPSLYGLDMAGFLGTLANTAFTVYEDLRFSSGMTLTSGTNAITLAGSTTFGVTQNVTSNGQTIDFPMTKTGTGTMRLIDNFTMNSARTFTHTQGTVNLNNRIMSVGIYSTSNSNTRNITFGAGQLFLTSTGTVFNAATSTGMSITPNTGKIVLSDNSNTARTFDGGGLITYPELEIGGDTGTSTTTFLNPNGFAKLTSTKTVPYTIIFPNTTTRVANWNVNGSEGNLITLSRTGGSGTFTIQYTGNQYGLGRYLSISNSTATPVNRMYAIYSTDGGGNTNWIFDAPKFSQFINFFDIA